MHVELLSKKYVVLSAHLLPSLIKIWAKGGAVFSPLGLPRGCSVDSSFNWLLELPDAIKTNIFNDHVSHSVHSLWYQITTLTFASPGCSVVLDVLSLNPSQVNNQKNPYSEILLFLGSKMIILICIRGNIRNKWLWHTLLWNKAKTFITWNATTRNYPVSIRTFFW